MMIFFSLYFPILLSLSLSFFLHAFNKNIHSFFALISTFNTTTHYKLQKKCHHLISSTATANVLPLPAPPPIGGGIGRLVTCTESLGFESFEIENDDGDDNNMIYNDSDGEVEEEGGGAAAEGREEAFPPPLSSLDGNGQPSFVLLPVRKDGRLQLSKVRVKRPEILRATRQDGRLRLYLIPDVECMVDDDMEQEESEEEETEEVGVETEEETGEEETEEVVGKRVVKVSITFSYWLSSPELPGTSPERSVEALHNICEFLSDFRFTKGCLTTAKTGPRNSLRIAQLLPFPCRETPPLTSRCELWKFFRSRVQELGWSIAS